MKRIKHIHKKPKIFFRFGNNEFNISSAKLLGIIKIFQSLILRIVDF